MSRTLDLITIGRSSVDLYGQQIGGRLEDMGSFSKAVGGCPANIAIGTARLGLRSGIVTRVGDEHFGRFIRERMAREGVSTDGIHTDPDRLTALAILGVRDSDSFPLIFYRTDCADAALDESDIDEDFIRSARAVVVTGTHFSRPHNAAAQRKAMRLAHEAGGRVVFDIDYRPNLWGLAGHGAGESRYIRSDSVTDRLAEFLPECDLIVGTEEELHIAGGSENTLDAIRRIRALAPGATVVCKRGPMGCVVFAGPIPDSLEDGVKGPGFPVEVYNTLGAGDAFMSGFLRGWLRDEPLETCCAYANASGAFAVSRLLCSPEIPSFAELEFFLRQGSPLRALRHDDGLNHLHWATANRSPTPHAIMALACDHRMQLEAVATEAGASFDRIAPFKVLAVEAAARVAAGRPGFGMFLDGRYGREALFRASHAGLWTARPVERTGSRPLEFEGGPDGRQPGSLGAALVEWPTDQVIKCLCFYRPDDAEELRLKQERELLRAQDACRRLGRDLLVEIIAGKHGALEADTVSTILSRLYDIGLKPDWWKLEPQRDAAAWARTAAVVAGRDPLCRGIVLLGLEAPAAELVEAFAVAAAVPLVKGFAIGRTIFIDPARDWMSGRITDAEAVEVMAARFGELVAAWERVRPGSAPTGSASQIDSSPAVAGRDRAA
ncbi:bifunctional 5-dehydro-2-deoxygluconokinase/5-dehydro-2-deoxyphosphogluconate aldolase [Rhizosaccharibacter radicis]|uniref:5-dehydro-2-deoxygluconokinase n=1 Tax=Rhizosaccharibacter radicis TaxID=2782605 RepID=A0ABT1VSH1_9PROT|nr:5-dehydro-2-deoxygluconokinase [Acetobacteraceae bacterium KSS12]